ncbi:hypothetical protein D9M68_959510 [compost metagenome]
MPIYRGIGDAARIVGIVYLDQFIGGHVPNRGIRWPRQEECPQRSMSLDGAAGGPDPPGILGKGRQKPIAVVVIGSQAIGGY